MKKIVQIVSLILIVSILGASCASSKKTPNRKSQVNCPAYGHKSNGYERFPY